MASINRQEERPLSLLFIIKIRAEEWEVIYFPRDFICHSVLVSEKICEGI